jgi:tetratricopeptide (TPR) repeat protein
VSSDAAPPRESSIAVGTLQPSDENAWLIGRCDTIANSPNRILGGRHPRELLKSLSKVWRYRKVNELAQFRPRAHDYADDYRRMVQADEHTLRHLASYLSAAEHKERLRQLLVETRNWLDAKAERFGSDTEYLEDLTLAIGSSTSKHEGDLVFRVSLYTARLVAISRLNRYPYDAVEALVWLGREIEAIRLTRLRPRHISGKIISNERTGVRGAESTEGQAILGFSRIYYAGYQRDSGLSPWLFELQQEMFAMLRSSDPEDRDEAIPEVVPVLIEAKQYEMVDVLHGMMTSEFKRRFLTKDLIRMYASAEQYARAEALLSGLDTNDHDDGLAAIGAACARGGRYEEAMTHLKALKSDWTKTRLRRSLALQYARHGQWNEVKKQLARIKKADIRVSDMCEFSSSAFALGDLERAEWWSQNVREAIPSVPEIYDWSSAEEQRCHAYLEYAHLLKNLGHESECRRAVMKAAEYAFSSPTSHEVEQSTVKVLNAMGILGFRDDVESILARTPVFLRGWFQANVARAVAAAGHLDFAEKLGSSLRGKQRQAALLVLSIANAKAGNHEEASRHFENAIAASQTDETSLSTINSLCAVSRCLFELRHPSASPVLDLAIQRLKRVVDELASTASSDEPLSWAFTSSRVGELSEERKLIALELIRQDRLHELLELARSRSIQLYVSDQERALIEHKILLWKERLTASEINTLSVLFRLDESSPMFVYELNDIPFARRAAMLKSRLTSEPRPTQEAVAGILTSLISATMANGEFDDSEVLVFSNRQQLSEYGFCDCIRVLVRTLLQSGEVQRAELAIARLASQAKEDYHCEKALWYGREELGKYYVRQERWEELRQMTGSDALSWEKEHFTYAIAEALAEKGELELAESWATEISVHRFNPEGHEIVLANVAKASGKCGDTERAERLMSAAYESAVSRSDWFGTKSHVDAILIAAGDAGMCEFVLSKQSYEDFDRLVLLISMWTVGLRSQFNSKAEATQLSVLQEVARIASWAEQRWLEVYEAISNHT